MGHPQGWIASSVAEGVDMMVDVAPGYDFGIEKELNNAFNADWLREQAKITGVVKRERKIDPVAIFWVLVLGFGVELQRNLANLKRIYSKRTGENVSDSSWYDRFSPELVKFMKASVIHGLEYLAQGPHRKLAPRLERFKDVVIQDSTIIRVHEIFAKTWPATRSRKVAAGVKVGMLVSAVSNGPKNVMITAENTNEIKTLKIGPWVRDRVLLMDLGFFKYQLFARIMENGGFFVSRLKDNAEPWIISSNNVCRGNSIDVVGKPLSEVIPRLQRQIIDVQVEVDFKRRKYNGSRSADKVEFRMVGIYNEDEDKYHLYITNIPVETLSAEDVAAVYGARWEIELIFKELKSKYSLDVIKTQNKMVVEALIWTAILTLLVSRIIYHVIRKRALDAGKDVARLTPLRWSTVFADNARDHLHVLLHYLGIGMDPYDFYLIYESQAFDPHVNRKRLRDDLWA